MIVYKLTSPSGKCYIGITSRTLEQRFNSHIAAWKGNRKSKLYSAFDKHPPKTWTKEVLSETATTETEKEFITKFNSIEEGYNIHFGGTDCHKIASINRGNKQTEDHIQRRVSKMRGFKQSDYQKQRASEALSATWMITHPNGKTETITNLRRFCHHMGLDQGNLSRGKHKGYKAVKTKY
jgi:predicted GIY-YIG superfamily endonuclease